MRYPERRMDHREETKQSLSEKRAKKPKQASKQPKIYKGGEPQPDAKKPT
jgi:hypothetical protein